VVGKKDRRLGVRSLWGRKERRWGEESLRGGCQGGGLGRKNKGWGNDRAL